MKTYRKTGVWVACLLILLMTASCALRYPERPEHSARASLDPRLHIRLADYGLGSDSVQGSILDIGTGTKVYLWMPERAKAIILVQHGILDYALRYVSASNHLIPRFIQAGYAVCAIDARSHGYSYGEQAIVDVQDAVADHLAVRRKLATYGLPVIAFGHSMGGTITARSASLDQTNLAGVILLAPALYSPKFAPWYLRLGGSILSALTPRLGIRRLEKLPDDPAQRDPLVSTLTVAARPGRTIYGEAMRTEKSYKHITIPVLLIHGDADDTTDPASSRRMYERISSQDKTLYILSGSGHSPLNDPRYQQETTSRILAWLAQHTS